MRVFKIEEAVLRIPLGINYPLLIALTFAGKGANLVYLLLFQIAIPTLEMYDTDKLAKILSALSDPRNIVRDDALVEKLCSSIIKGKNLLTALLPLSRVLTPERRKKKSRAEKIILYSSPPQN